MQSMLTANYTNTVSLDGIYIDINLMGPIQNRIFGRETY